MNKSKELKKITVKRRNRKQKLNISNKTKHWFLEKTNKNWQTFNDTDQRKREQEKIVNIRNEKKNLTTYEADNRKIKLLITPNQCI